MLGLCVDDREARADRQGRELMTASRPARSLAALLSPPSRRRS
jgi:hypothetical protein